MKYVNLENIQMDERGNVFLNIRHPDGYITQVSVQHMDIAYIRQQLEHQARSASEEYNKWSGGVRDEVLLILKNLCPQSNVVLTHDVNTMGTGENLENARLTVKQAIK